MIKRIHHIGIGVKDLEQIKQFFEYKLGLELIAEVSWPGLKAALFPVGAVTLELIEPLKPETKVAESLHRLVQKRDVGVHHLCLEVDNIEALVEALRAKDVRMIGEAPQEAAGGKIAWLDENTLDGVMIELCQEGYEIK